MNIAARCRQHGWAHVAFIGAAKHAGKTTALGGFIEDARELGAVVGLCSIGLDGERLDTILGVEKPAIHAPAGSLVVSAERALEQSEARFDWLEALPIASPLGTVMVARVVHPGRVVLAGVRQRIHVEQAIQRLTAYGAGFCLVDGAFDRVAAAAPHLVDAVVLAVGAVTGRTVTDVVRHALPLLRRFQLPALSTEWKQRLAEAYKACEIGLFGSDGLVQIPARSALFGVTQHPAWTPDVHALYLPGAVTDSVLAGVLQQRPQPLQIAAAHPAQVLLQAETYKHLYRAGHSLSVWTPLPVAGIAANPHSIAGYDLPQAALQAALREVAGDIPVYDAMRAQEVSGHGQI